MLKLGYYLYKAKRIVFSKCYVCYFDFFVAYIRVTKYLRSIRKTVSSIAASEKEGLSEEDKATANIILGVMRTTLENTFEQYRKGLIGEDFYQGITVQTIKTFGPAILSQDLWLTPDFKKEIEMILISS